MLFLPLLASAQQLLNTMVLNGSIAPSSDGKVAPIEGDVVLAVNGNTGVTEGTGLATDSGTYGIILSDKPASLNGVPLLLQLKRGGNTFKLLRPDGNDAIVAFNGSFLPVRVTMNVVASSEVVGGTGGGGTGGGGTGGGGTSGGEPGGGSTPPASVRGDINGDTTIDERDIQLLKQAIAGKIPMNTEKMDVTGDGVVNTRDLIEMIRAVRDQAFKSARDQARSSAKVQAPASARPAR
jgi:hypothetical protein